MSAEERLDQMESKLAQLEKRQDQRIESYERLLNGFQRILGGDIEKRDEVNTTSRSASSGGDLNG